MSYKENSMQIDIKALGNSIGRRIILNKPNVGKNPKDGDGDGFIVDLNTGLDNVPVRKIKPSETQNTKKKLFKFIPRTDRDPDNEFDEKETSDVIKYLHNIAGSNKKPEKWQEDSLNKIRQSLKKRGMTDNDIENEIKIAKEDNRKLSNPNPVEMADILEEINRQTGNRIDGNVNRGNSSRVQRRYATYWQGGGRMSFEEWSKRDMSRNPRDYRNDSLTATRNREEWPKKSFSPINAMPEEHTEIQIASRDDEDAELEPRQRMMYEFFELIAKKMGKWSQDSGPDGAHYMDEHPFGNKGLKCLNCSFFQGGNRCEVVTGEIMPDAICKLWVIRKDLVKE